MDDVIKDMVSSGTELTIEEQFEMAKYNKILENLDFNMENFLKLKDLILSAIKNNILLEKQKKILILKVLNKYK